MSYYQQIYNRLRQNGITQAGALGVLGNFDCESNCEPFRVQGDFSPYRTASKAYVQGLTNGSISREQFSRDGKGYGIYQLTYWTRKQGYYDFWKASGKAVDDATLQVDYALKEMASDYPQLLAFLKSTTDIFTATSRVCREFERPAVNNIDARFSAAKRIQGTIDLNVGESGGGDEPTPTPQPTVDHRLNLRTIDSHCDGWNEALLLKGLLLCRGYDFEQISSDLWAVVKQFQAENNLVPDGIVGNLTWTKLLER